MRTRCQQLRLTCGVDKSGGQRVANTLVRGETKKMATTTTTAVLSLNGKPQVTPPRGAEGQQQQDVSAVGVATQQVMQVLGALARIQISDGRIIVGRLHCFDKHQNVILTDAREYAPISDAKDKSKGTVRKQNEDQAPQNEDDDAAFEAHRRATTSRHLGMTLVPGKHIVYIKVQA